MQCCSVIVMQIKLAVVGEWPCIWEKNLWCTTWGVRLAKSSSITPPSKIIKCRLRFIRSQPDSNGFPLLSSKVSRACVWHNLWQDMETMDQILQGMLSMLLRCDLSTSSSLFSLFTYWTIFISHTRGQRWRDIGKNDFCSVLYLHILSNARRRAG